MLQLLFLGICEGERFLAAKLVHDDMDEASIAEVRTPQVL